MNPSFWNSRKVFLTGHTGFKGSWLALWLLSMGAEVCGYALDPPTDPSLYRLLDLDRQLQSIRGDIRDLAALESAVRDFQPEVVIHMAAQPLVRPSYQSPVETYAVNVIGTVHLLDAIRRTPSVRAAVVVTSDKCYENQEWHWPYREHEPMGGHDPYSSSKGCAELVPPPFAAPSFIRTAAAAIRSPWPPRVPEMSSAAATGRSTVWFRTSCVPGPWASRRNSQSRGCAPVAARSGAACRISGVSRAPFRRGRGLRRRWNFGPADGDARPVRYLVSELARLWGDAARGDAWSRKRFTRHTAAP